MKCVLLTAVSLKTLILVLFVDLAVFPARCVRILLTAVSLKPLILILFVDLAVFPARCVRILQFTD